MNIYVVTEAFADLCRVHKKYGPGNQMSSPTLCIDRIELFLVVYHSITDKYAVLLEEIKAS